MPWCIGDIGQIFAQEVQKTPCHHLFGEMKSRVSCVIVESYDQVGQYQTVISQSLVESAWDHRHCHHSPHSMMISWSQNLSELVQSVTLCWQGELE